MLVSMRVDEVICYSVPCTTTPVPFFVLTKHPCAGLC